MKKFFRPAHLLWGVLVLSGLSFGASVPQSSLSHVQPSPVSFNEMDNLPVEEFLALTPKKFKEKTGRKLSLKEVFALKKIQKKIKKTLGKNPAGGKDQLVALILVLLVGWVGIHRFYLGYTGIGIIQLMTLGCCGIWTLIDMIRIITGDLQPRDGYYEEIL
jgi:hypothetical protein